MDEETISYDSSDVCRICGSTNWVIDDGSRVLHASVPTEVGDRACNDCGAVWRP